MSVLERMCLTCFPTWSSGLPEPRFQLTSPSSLLVELRVLQLGMDERRLGL